MKTIIVKRFSEVPNNFTGIAELTDGTIIYYLYGQVHRLDGPAVMYDRNIPTTYHYYINGKFISCSEKIFHKSKLYKRWRFLENMKKIKGV